MELKCLTRLESRRACRAGVIKAAIVCGKGSGLGRKKLENLKNLQVEGEFEDGGAQHPPERLTSVRAELVLWRKKQTRWAERCKVQAHVKPKGAKVKCLRFMWIEHMTFRLHSRSFDFSLTLSQLS